MNETASGGEKMQDEAQIERIITGALEESEYPPDLSAWKREEGYVGQYCAAVSTLLDYADRHGLDHRKAIGALNSGIHEERVRQIREHGRSLSYLIRENAARYDFLMQQRIEAGMAKALNGISGGYRG